MRPGFFDGLGSKRARTISFSMQGVALVDRFLSSGVVDTVVTSMHGTNRSARTSFDAKSLGALIETYQHRLRFTNGDPRFDRSWPAG